MGEEQSYFDSGKNSFSFKKLSFKSIKIQNTTEILISGSSQRVRMELFIQFLVISKCFIEFRSVTKKNELFLFSYNPPILINIGHISLNSKNKGQEITCLIFLNK